MQKIIIGFVVAGILIVVGVASFFIFTKDESKVAEIVNEVKEAGESQVQEQKVQKSGSFIKIDPLHYASGQVKVEKAGENYKLVFQENFSAAPGPDLYVYLSSSQTYRNIAVGGLDTAKTVNAGVLKSGSGRQEYLVSKRDFETYGDAVVIWCKQFGVQFSRADLK